MNARNSRNARTAAATPHTPDDSRKTRIAALVLLQLGALCVVLLALPYKTFELDRFFVPKELALHAAALLGALLCLWRVRTFALDRADTFLLSYLALSTLSAIFAKNHGLAVRALAVTLSGAAIFWTARALARAGFRRALVAGVVLAVVVGALTGLLQAYGMESEYASLARAPGGTFGNRNFMAHLCAIGTPVLVWAAATARKDRGAMLGAFAAMLLGAALVLSRSRAAWLALIVCLGLLAIPFLLTVRRTSGTPVGRRIAFVLIGMAVGLLAAIALPNHLNWKSDSPYLDSVKGVVDYSSGSGKGRVIQYKNSLRMALDHPVLGVGPGNWPVYYRRYAKRHDPSLLQSTGRPANPWPSSDWVAFVAERGALAAVALLLTLVGIVVTTVTTWTARRAEDSRDAADTLAPLALTGTILVTMIVGAFDAVLLLGAPTLIVWALVGALSAPGRPRVVFTPPDGVRRRWITVGAAVGVALVAWSGAQVAAMAQSCRTAVAFTLERCRR